MKRQTGLSLLEMLVTLAVIGMSVAVTLPNFSSMRRKMALSAATREMTSVFRMTRATAIAEHRNVAVRFRQAADATWTFSLFADGDFDGVRNDDIADGIDPCIRPAEPLLKENEVAAIAMPNIPLTDPDDNHLIDPSASPVYFGSSGLCSFSPTGASTAGSVVISDRNDNVAMVRVFGTTGRIRSLLYDAFRRKWRSR